MTSDDGPLDDRFLAEMAELDEALAAGQPSDSSRSTDRDPALDARRERARACLERLQRLRPGRQSDSDPTARDSHGPEGQHLGRFQIVRELGRGGFGVVFLAEQQHPVRRKVALKILRPGMDSRPVLARFEAERQALALMDHPNIATVLDGGATSDGRPYFVMELVNGVPVTDFCDRNRLPPRQRLGMFVQVCRAVQHAHQKGVIHRDLKPSNVLVTVHDTAPVVKVIDFGVAKAIGQDLTDKTLLTGVAQMVGTPMYMSPEQAGQSGLDVDTRSDIYSLGVMLYELLTGTTPFDKDRLHGAGYDELRRIIREEEPARPSTRVSTLGLAGSTISANRGSDPRRLSALFRGELDWIVMKALEKDRTRRYETANDLAADLLRYLADEPVQACPPSAWYRACKFARRNKLALAVTAAVVVVALGAATILAVSNAVIDRKQRETERALSAETAAREDLQRAVDRERRNYFGYAFELARRDWLAGDIEQARRQLQNCPAELRDRDWEYLHRACRAELRRLEVPVGGATLLRYSPDGKYLATSTSIAGRITVWDTVTGQERATLPTTGAIAGLAFSPDGNELIWATDGYQRSPEAVYSVRPPVLRGGFEVTVWDLVNGRRVAGCSRKEGGYVVLSRDGARAMLAVQKPSGLAFSPPESVAVYDTRTGRELCTLAVPSGHLPYAAFHPDGHILTLSSSEKAIRFWDVTTGRMARKVDCPVLNRFALSPDGQRLAVVVPGTPPRVAVLDVLTFREIAVVRGLAVNPTSMAFSPDGRRLATGGSDRVASVWDADTGRELLTLRGHPFAVWDVAFSPDGSCLASSSRAVRIWDVSPPYAPGLGNPAVK